MTDRELLIKWWDEAWAEGLWAAAWPKAVEGLTAEQAAWTPKEGGPGRHSIWQNVLHMIFWREDNLRRLAGGGKPTEAELAAGNFPVIGAVTEQAWTEARRRLAETHEQIAAALRNPANPIDRVQYLIPHDSYHIGQICLLRGMMGMKAIE